MHAFGGLYVDLDVQCFRSAEPSLLGHDIVLQSEYREGRDIVNSIMASVPGHPFWKAVITEMLEVPMPCQACTYCASTRAEIIVQDGSCMACSTICQEPVCHRYIKAHHGICSAGSHILERGVTDNTGSPLPAGADGVLLAVQKWHHAHGKVDTDVILDSGGPRLYGNVFQKWTAGTLKTPAFVGAHDVRPSQLPLLNHCTYGSPMWSWIYRLLN